MLRDVRFLLLAQTSLLPSARFLIEIVYVCDAWVWLQPSRAVLSGAVRYRLVSSLVVSL